MLYAIPSIIAITIKLLILWKRPFSRPTETQSFLFSDRLLLSLFITLLLLNICEVALFFSIANTPNALALVTGYHVFYIYTLFIILAIALKLVLEVKALPFLLIVASVLATAMIWPQMSIIGTKSIGYSVSRIPGPYYSLVVVGSLSALLLSTGLFAWGALFNTEPARKIKCKILLACLAPFTVTTFSIAILMQYGIDINATVVTSFTINILLLGLLYSESKYYIPQIMAAVPGTRYFHSTETLASALFDPNIPLDEAKEIMVLEKTLRALQLTNGNQTEAAKMLGISRPTICRRIKALECYKGLPKPTPQHNEFNQAG